MRIADLLKTDDHNDDYLVSSPPSVLSRWLSSLKRSRDPCSSRRKLASLRCEEKRADDGSKRQPSSSISAEFSSPTDVVASSGRYMKEVSFNLGLGVGLVFLIATSKNEFNKMVELRTQMEMIIKDIKGEMQKKDPSESNDNVGFSTTNSNDVGNTNYHSTIQNCEESEIAIECDQYRKCDKPREECMLGIDQLEAELEAELEYLQLHLDAEDLSEHPQQQQIEMVVANTAPDGSFSANFGEVDDPKEADDGERCGVSPNELERRLHELLEARHRERIKELESALECAKHKLRQKDMEISWWKDIARLISQHVQEPTCFSR